ncbi:hypothetical protein BH09PLA1_BH09PLA1_35570 [soil metagenome]
MPWAICFLVGAVLGAGAVFVLLIDRFRKAKQRETAAEQLTANAKQLQLDAIATEKEVERREVELRVQRNELEQRTISYANLQHENVVLKRDPIPFGPAGAGRSGGDGSR